VSAAVSAKGFVVHGIPSSPYLRAVLVTLDEKRQAFRLAALAPGSRNTPGYLALQPFGKIPAFEHDGFRLYETHAILRYLDRVVPRPALTPAEVKAAARMDQLMNINDWYLFNGVVNVIGFQRVVGPRLARSHEFAPQHGTHHLGGRGGAGDGRLIQDSVVRPAIFDLPYDDSRRSSGSGKKVKHWRYRARRRQTDQCRGDLERIAQRRQHRCARNQRRQQYSRQRNPGRMLCRGWLFQGHTTHDRRRSDDE
jgi:Glutathione S-transferase, N-terminal domain